MQALRGQTGLIQTEFADQVNKPQSVISRLENTEYGKVTVQTLLEIACALDVALLVRFVSYPEFLDRTKDMSPRGLRVENVYQSINAVGIGQALRLPPSQTQEAVVIPLALPQRQDQPGRQNDLGSQLSSIARVAAE